MHIKINNTSVEKSITHLDIVMPKSNLLEYSDNYCITSASLWNHYRDEVNDDTNKNVDANNKMNNNKK